MQKLPIDSALEQLVQTVVERGSLVVTADPGAGKTTRLPPRLLSITDKAVWVIEPRRIAAISASQRIAEENGWRLSEEVGYQVRFENKSTPRTRLLFLTEGLLLRKLLRDPELRNVGCVVLDEFHERSIHVDLALAALKELRELARPDLKIVVMSATLDSQVLSAYLNDAPVVHVPGKIFPMTMRYADRSLPVRTGPDFCAQMQRLLERAAAENPEGDILCFLPGRGEIEQILRSLESSPRLKNTAILPLHGQLNLDQQRQAIAAAPPGMRKIVLATNVAESSLTVQGVRVVVDSGLARVAQLHPRTGFESLDLVRISKASAIQRAGRAARLGPGYVYRAWTAHDELSMRDFETAEIFRTDLAESLLLLAALGVSNFNNFSWYETPSPRSLDDAKRFLAALGALNEAGALTQLGEAIRDLPLHPRLAKLLLVGKARGLERFTCEIAALLADGKTRAPGDPQDGEIENDIWLAWENWQRHPNAHFFRGINRNTEQLRRLLENTAASALAQNSVDKNPRAHHDLEEALPELLLEVYSDRLCRRRRAGDPQAKMAGGRGVRLHAQSSVKTAEYFLAVGLTEGREIAETSVLQAVALPESLVEAKFADLAKPTVRVEWDEETQRFTAIEARTWNGITLGREHRRSAAPAEVEAQIVDLAFARWDRLLAGNKTLGNWFARLQFLSKNNAAYPLPKEEQLKEALAQACYGENSLARLQEKDLVPYFENILRGEHREKLARDCPEFFLAPTGSRLPIIYSPDQGPQVEVRLQELFGLPMAPMIAGQALTLVLLGPNYRPVQITRDLASFWKNGYLEVRKELRSRYPKHSWPEDPLTAPPQAKGRSRK